MASEVIIARESGARPLNALRSTRRQPVGMNMTLGGKAYFTISTDEGKNEAMRFLSDYLNVSGRPTNMPSVDSYIRERNGSYEVKVWTTTGNNWGSGKFGSIVEVQNNTGKTLSLKKQRGRWRGTFTERQNYGRPDKVTRLF